MRISWNWLRTLADLGDMTPREAADVLTSTGLEVESVEVVETVKGMLAGVVVGHVLECVEHPDAARLSVCKVDVGSPEPLGIVCGAPNVAAGQKVLVATPGTILHTSDGTVLTIKRSKIRGVESAGMICAEDELGIGGSHAGILVLDPSAVVGRSAAEQLGLRSDHALEIGLTPNRADAMSHIGVARDLVAAMRIRTNSKAELRWPAVPKASALGAQRVIPVDVLAAGACHRYVGVTLTHIRVGPSPPWIQERLTSIGLKPINNVVDVTNYVQHELGQPLHAFDADQLEGEHIVVRMATEGEHFTTLDGKERVLSSQDLVIADAVKPACLAGVFGGAASGVSDATTTIFLESACFDPATIRRTARRHGLNTDASFRFERGVDPGITVTAALRAVQLLTEVAGAQVASAMQDIGSHRIEPAQVRLRFARVDALCGVSVAPVEVKRILLALDCRVLSEEAGSVLVEVPPYRVDVTREADLIEEVLRILGFDQVPVPERLSVPALVREEVTFDGVRSRMALHLSARGFREVMTPSLVSMDRAVRTGSAQDADLVRLRNPLSAELDALRPTMLFGLLAAAAHNIARQQRDLRLFEHGRIYRTTGKTAVEEERTALLITGERYLENWRAKGRRTELADPQEDLASLVERFGLRNVELRSVEHPLLASTVEIHRKEVVFARAGEVRPAVLRAFDVGQATFFAELLDTAWSHALVADRPEYREIPRFPAVKRDLSLLLDSSVRYQDLQRTAFQAERKLLRTVDLFDVYEGDKLPAGKKSYALRFLLQDPDKTLTDEQVEKAMDRIRQALEKETGATLRG